METERDRTCKAGFDQSSTVERRRRCMLAEDFITFKSLSFSTTKALSTFRFFMISANFFEGKEVGTMELNDAVFGVEVNEHLVHMAVDYSLHPRGQLRDSAP